MATKSAAKKFEVTPEFNAEVAAWMKAEAELSKWKVEELTRRNKIIAMIFPNGKVPEGTNNIALPDGWVAKVAGKVNISVDETLVEEARKMNAELANPSPYFDQVIRYKPSLSITSFKELDAQQQKVVRHCLVEKPGASGLEIVKPKRAVK